MIYPVQQTDAQWQQILQAKNAEPLAYQITRQAATERAHTGRWAQHWGTGVYRCICCEQVLFDSNTKFDAGCGWPSFYAPLIPQAVHTQEDTQLWMPRTEVLCAQCGAHLGHVFDDGPAPTGLRYCINSASLNFDPA